VNLPEDRIVAQYLAGETAANLAIDYETNDHRIRAILRRHGVPLRPRHTSWSKEQMANIAQRNKRIVSAYLEGELTVEQIANAFGVVPMTVHRAVKAAGVVNRKYPPKAIPEVTTEVEIDRSECGGKLK
jgi:DNA-directed RNA polymerase specialized sigma subunit